MLSDFKLSQKYKIDKDTASNTGKKICCMKNYNIANHLKQFQKFLASDLKEQVQVYANCK